MNQQRKNEFLGLVRPIAAAVLVSSSAVAFAETPQTSRAGVEYSPPKIELSASDFSWDSIKARLQSMGGAFGSDSAASKDQSAYVELPSANRSGNAPFERSAAIPSGPKSVENDAKDGRGAQEYVPEPVSASSSVDNTRPLAANLLASQGTRDPEEQDRSGVRYDPVRYDSFGQWWDVVSK